MPTLPRVIFTLSMCALASLVPCQARRNAVGFADGVPSREVWNPLRVPGTAHAADPPPAAALPFRERPPELDHRHQFGLAVMPGFGYRVIVPYEGQPCLEGSANDTKSVCTDDVPMFLDVQVGYGISSRIDLITDLRFGLAREDALGVGRQFALAPGMRVWLDREVRLKFFTTLQFLFDATTNTQPRVRYTDYGIRNSNGLMYDALRNVGVYVQFGDTIGFVRWFRIELDIGLGVQVRLP